MPRPKFLDCIMTSEIIHRIIENQKHYDKDPEGYERRERDHKEEREREQQEQGLKHFVMKKNCVEMPKNGRGKSVIAYGNNLAWRGIVFSSVRYPFWKPMLIFPLMFKKPQGGCNIKYRITIEHL